MPVALLARVAAHLDPSELVLVLAAACSATRRAAKTLAVPMLFADPIVPGILRCSAPVAQAEQAAAHFAQVWPWMQRVAYHARGVQGKFSADTFPALANARMLRLEGPLHTVGILKFVNTLSVANCTELCTVGAMPCLVALNMCNAPRLRTVAHLAPQTEIVIHNSAIDEFVSMGRTHGYEYCTEALEYLAEDMQYATSRIELADTDVETGIDLYRYWQASNEAN